MAEIRLAARNHQWLEPLHLDLHFPHGAHLDGVTQGGSCAMAFPDSGFWRRHPSLTDRTPNALLLCRTVRCGHTGTAAVLANLGPTEVSPSVVIARTSLQTHAGSAVAYVVSVRR